MDIQQKMIGDICIISGDGLYVASTIIDNMSFIAEADSESVAVEKLNNLVSWNDSSKRAKRIIFDLDEYCRKVDTYAYGLPTHNEDLINQMVAIITKEFPSGNSKK